MSRRDLNYFTPYAGSGENHLTRATLSFLRLVPMAQVEFLRLVDPAIVATKLPADVEIDFQTSKLHPEFAARLESGEVDAGDVAVGPEVISVYLTPDVVDRPIEVVESTRNAIYDGVIRYGESLVLAVESKLREGIDARQAQDISLGDLTDACRLRPRGAHVRWHDLFEAWMPLEERQMIAPAERALLADFFAMVEGDDRLSALLPFTTLERAGRNATRRDRRIRALLQAATGLEPQSDWAWHVTGPPGAWQTFSRMYLWGDEHKGFNLGIWPGEQQRQAKVLYGDRERAHRLAALDQCDVGHATWSVTPRMAVAVRIPALFLETTCDVSAGEFIDLWSGSLPEIHRYGASELDALFRWMTEHRVADAEHDRERFYATFVEPQRSQVDPRPALAVIASWDWDQAVRLDDDAGTLTREIRRAADAVLEALNEQPLG